MTGIASIDEHELTTRIGEVLNRWPTAGLAVGVVRGGSLAWFHGHGVADVATKASVTEDTVFRIASITKTFTAIAVMQLEEQGLVDLDAPVADHLRAFRLVPATAGFRQATLRHLLTHTAGVRAVRSAADLLRPAMAWGAPSGRAPSLAEYYRGGLRVDVEPGSRWAYSNHGFATLGQVVEDVTGIPFDRYLRERLFDPLGMDRSDLVRSDRVRSRLATGYALGRRGLAAVADREIVTAGASAAYSTMRDMARYVAALLGGGANAHGSVLRPETVARMFAPHHQPDPRLGGLGLAFFRDEIAGHRTVGHDGIWTGFRTDMTLAPDAGVGVLAFANTGWFDPRGAPGPAANAVLRALLGVGPDVVRTDLPEHPEVWGDLCGRYAFGPGVLTDPQPRMLLGPGVEVVVRRNRLVLRGMMPIPAVRRGLRLHPDGDDPYVLRADLSAIGPGTSRVAFGRGPAGDVTALHVGLTGMSLRKLPAARAARSSLRARSAPRAG
jgi:CubicO group peptidase (beta-lactamase class C family)